MWTDVNIACLSDVAMRTDTDLEHVPCHLQAYPTLMWRQSALSHNATQDSSASMGPVNI